MAASQQHAEIFEDVLNLEEQYYREGYDLGVADGSKSGRIEGRLFGLEKGFDKFMEMGRLRGRVDVWESRIKHSSSVSDSQKVALQLAPLPGNERLRKHVGRLAALSDPDDLSTENNEDAVTEFEDRLKDAKAKAALIARIVGEDEATEANQQGAGSSDRRERLLQVTRNERAAATRPTGEMEDFTGLPGSRS